MKLGFSLALAAAAMLVCGGASAQQPIVIKFSHVVALDTPKGKGADHAQYITREGRFKEEKYGEIGEKESGNLPEWARGSAARFFAAADEYERANGNSYRELELALPVELSDAERGALVRVDHPMAGPVVVPNTPLRFRGSTMAELRPSPALGADTRVVLAEWLGLDEDALDRLADDGVV